MKDDISPLMYFHLIMTAWLHDASAGLQGAAFISRFIVGSPAAAAAHAEALPLPNTALNTNRLSYTVSASKMPLHHVFSADALYREHFDARLPRQAH